jgi:hypothetical protein
VLTGISAITLATHDMARAIAYRDAIGEAAPPRGYAEMRDAFDAPTPEQGKTESDVIDQLVALSAPGLRAMTGRRFFGWVIGAFAKLHGVQSGADDSMASGLEQLPSGNRGADHGATWVW